MSINDEAVIGGPGGGAVWQYTGSLQAAFGEVAARGPVAAILVGGIDQRTGWGPELEAFVFVGQRAAVDLVRREIGDDGVIGAFEQEIASGGNAPLQLDGGCAVRGFQLPAGQADAGRAWVVEFQPFIAGIGAGTHPGDLVDDEFHCYRRSWLRWRCVGEVTQKSRLVFRNLEIACEGVNAAIVRLENDKPCSGIRMAGLERFKACLRLVFTPGLNLTDKNFGCAVFWRRWNRARTHRLKQFHENHPPERQRDQQGSRHQPAQRNLAVWMPDSKKRRTVCHINENRSNLDRQLTQGNASALKPR
jgi:hypothetical protein